MTQQSRAEAYEILHRVLEHWAYEPHLTPSIRRKFDQAETEVKDAIDAAVDEAYLAGYNDGYDGKPEPEGFNPEYAESPWKAEL